MNYTIVIPCYNARDYIETTLDSIVHQEGAETSWEVIVVDDCSMDDSYAVVEQYASKAEIPVRILRNEKNSGPAVARNLGIANAQGDYLLFMDSDDYVASNLLQLVDKCIKETEADVVFYGNYQVIGNVKRKFSVTKHEDKYAYMALSLGSLCRFASKRTLWKDIAMPSISHAEDIAVIPILLARSKRIEAINECLYYYVNRGNSLSNSSSRRIVEEFQISFDYTYQVLSRKQEFYASLEFHGLKTILYGATLNALKCGMNKSELLNIWSSFEHKYPKWYENRYINSYNRSKRLFLYLVKFHNYGALKLYSGLHSFLLRIL